MTFKVEKNIPIIPILKSKYPFNDMEVGDSFLVKELKKYKVISSSCWHWGKKLKMKFITRATKDGVRVWRTK